MGSVSLEGVTKIFEDGDDEIVAVDDLSLDIENEEFLVLVGPSGCGKSTTLRMIAGLETPTEGRIYIDDRDITDLSPQERNIAMVFQSYALYPHMTVRENMSFGLEESTDLGRDEIESRVESAAEMLEIEDLLDRDPGDLSGGQQQRVALGRSLVREPDAFLLDEPLANLDAKLRAEMRTELQELHEDIGTTTIYVTHDQTEAMTMGSRIAILNDGKLQQVGAPLECYHEPANRFVAGFIGEPSMNFFDVTRRDGTLVGDFFEYSLPADVDENVRPATEVILGIRPEDVDIVSAVEREHDFPGVIEVVEPQGDANTVHLRFDSQDEESESYLTATTDGMRTLHSGESVVIRMPPETIHVFDAESGTALHNRRIEEKERLGRIGSA
ncbi:MAG: ABC transporter ATP-binding protein [Halodesulfurarchaeum sp.]